MVMADLRSDLISQSIPMYPEGHTQLYPRSLFHGVHDPAFLHAFPSQAASRAKGQRG